MKMNFNPREGPQGRKKGFLSHLLRLLPFNFSASRGFTPKAFTFLEVMIIIVITAVLAACCLPAFVKSKQGKPETPHVANGADYDAQLLFTIHDLKVYRFYDRGQYLYFVDGRNSSSVSWTETQRMGKITVTTSYEVTTLK